jgi:rhamnosyltransferase
VARDVGAAPVYGTGAIRPGPCRVSIVVPTRNGGARFLALLQRLARQEFDGGFELVVVDSSSSDGTADAAQRAGARVLRIDVREFNHGRSRNRGIELATGERVVLLVQDALPTGEHFVAALSAALDDPRIDGAYARQVPRPGQDPLIAARLRGWSAARNERSVSRLSDGVPEAARAAFERLAPMERYRACAFDDVAACLRRARWQEIPLPERNFGEDVAWARAVLLAGGAIAFEPRACVEHSHPISIAGEFARIYRDHRNLNELFGLRTVSSWREVWAGARSQRRFYRELLRAERLGGLARLRWSVYAGPYAFAETAAQFLGARSLWKARETGLRSAPWRWLDQRLQR